ncbi:MAG: hypothetical protein HZB19_16140 [Chloroflexi bacterium]|nr:hypothetical protein [Chloroflexota bacterium]
MNTEQFANEIKASIEVTIDAHTHHGKTDDAKIRLWDRSTPYAIHPIWCGMTLLTETSLAEDVRLIGYKALLWHDILEDTDFPLPEEVEPEVKTLVEEMTFPDGFEQEKIFLWERSSIAKLMKLYDKVSNLLDAAWMPDEQWNDHVSHALQLTDFVEKTYGNLNIVKISRAVAVLKK